MEWVEARTERRGNATVDVIVLFARIMFVQSQDFKPLGSFPAVGGGSYYLVRLQSQLSKYPYRLTIVINSDQGLIQCLSLLCVSISRGQDFPILIWSLHQRPSAALRYT